MTDEGKAESLQSEGRGGGFPSEIVLPSGRHLTLRLMGAPDRERILRFARSLPPDDLLFLRTDITEPAIVDQWIADLARGNSITVLAESGGELAGDATMHL